MAKKSGGRSSALQQPVQPDDELAAVVGSNPQPRTEITKKIWDYVKANNLQDPSNKRVIRADGKLRPVFGGKDQVDMFEMTRLVNQHIKKG
ncbi:MAG TPA: SWIB/MDM2 domain-containing protein [Thermoanaerobaculia bacterium]|nr:SWIB/MDM2 domain-containing protein [Thermoanaerobaculia bacterium]